MSKYTLTTIKPTPTAESAELECQLVNMLPDDPDKALWALASVVESCTHTLGESLTSFLDRVTAFRDARS
jgi:hypothetical protein